MFSHVSGDSTFTVPHLIASLLKSAAKSCRLEGELDVQMKGTTATRDLSLILLTHILPYLETGPNFSSHHSRHHHRASGLTYVNCH